MENKDTETKTSFWRTTEEVFWAPITWVSEPVILFLEWGDLLGKLFPRIEFWLSKFAVLSSFPWYWKVIVLLVVNGVLILFGNHKSILKREAQRDQYKAKLEEIENSKPIIVLHSKRSEYAEKTNFQYGDKIKLVTAVKVRFINKPTFNFPNSIAKDVRAKVSFFSEENDFLFEIEGRWTESDQPSVRDMRESRKDLLAVDLGIGEERSLDIAFREGGGDFFAFNNDSYDYPDFKKPEHHLIGKQFRVRILLLAPFVKEEFVFGFSKGEKPDEVLASKTHRF